MCHLFVPSGEPLSCSGLPVWGVLLQVSSTPSSSDFEASGVLAIIWYPPAAEGVKGQPCHSGERTQKKIQHIFLGDPVPLPTYSNPRIMFSLQLSSLAILHLTIGGSMADWAGHSALGWPQTATPQASVSS